jgi:septation ring formation regulator EzrA
MQFITLFIIIAILAIGIPVFLKKRKNKTVNSSISTRHNKDEV